MVKYLKPCALLLGSLMIFGCAGNQSGRSAEGAKADQINNSHSYAVAFDENTPHNPVAGSKIVKTAHKAIGTPYVLGGSHPGGFDCSGLVHWSYQSVGVELPRTAREQSVVGKKIGNIEEMRAGDIVAFRHPKRGYHTGIYVGDGKFIHSPRKRSTVRINSLSDPYFSKTLLGARRINVNSGENLVAQAESILGKETLATPTSIKRQAEARAKAAKAAKDAKTVAKNSKKQAHKAVAANTNTAKTGKTAHKQAPAKQAAKKQAMKKDTPKTGRVQSVAKAKAKAKVKHDNKVAAAKAHTPAAKIVASKADQHKKNNHKSVSMLQHKGNKSVAKSRNHL